MKKELYIQGLRAIAVISVLLFHANKDWLPGGFVGVDLFFVISGYLISSILLKKKHLGNKDLISFYSGRIRRIVPAYLAMLGLVTSACYYLMVYSPDFLNLYESLIAALQFNSANYFSKFGGYFAQASYELPFQHTWTLAVEMQFYLMLPLVLLFLPTRANKILLPILCVSLFAGAEYALRTMSGSEQRIYFSLIGRIPEFLVGAIISIYNIGQQWDSRSRNLSSALGLALIIASLTLINETMPFPGILALLPCIGTALLIASSGGIFAPILGSAAMVYVGDLSYSLYLWHWPILALVRYVRMEYVITPMWIAALFIATVPISWLSYRIVETPLRKGGNKLLFWTFVPAVIAVFCVVIPLKEWQIQRTDAVTPRKHLFFLTDDAYGYRFMYQDSCFGTIHGDCLRGNKNSNKPPMLVIGDSHAGQLARFFDVVAEKSGKPVRLIASPSCATIPSLTKV